MIPCIILIVHIYDSISPLGPGFFENLDSQAYINRVRISLARERIGFIIELSSHGVP